MPRIVGRPFWLNTFAVLELRQHLSGPSACPGRTGDTKPRAHGATTLCVCCLRPEAFLCVCRRDAFAATTVECFSSRCTQTCGTWQVDLQLHFAPEELVPVLGGGPRTLVEHLGATWPCPIALAALGPLSALFRRETEHLGGARKDAWMGGGLCHVTGSLHVRLECTARSVAIATKVKDRKAALALKQARTEVKVPSAPSPSSLAKNPIKSVSGRSLARGPPPVVWGLQP